LAAPSSPSDCPKFWFVETGRPQPRETARFQQTFMYVCSQRLPRYRANSQNHRPCLRSPLFCLQSILRALRQTRAWRAVRPGSVSCIMRREFSVAGCLPCAIAVTMSGARQDMLQIIPSIAWLLGIAPPATERAQPVKRLCLTIEMTHLCIQPYCLFSPVILSARGASVAGRVMETSQLCHGKSCQ
jgi:hypothetical protein